MKKLFNRLFCRHRLVQFARNIYGDGINAINARSIWTCSKCGKVILSSRLAKDHRGEPYKAEDAVLLIKRRVDIL